MTPYILVVLGLLLIFLEFCLPGALLGILGAALIVMSIVILFTQTTALLFFIQTLVILLLVSLVIAGSLSFIRRTSSQGSLYLESDQQGYVASEFDETLIGKKGTAMTVLRPAGHVLIDGKLLQAVSDSAYIEQGKPICVLRGQGAVLVVEECQE